MADTEYLAEAESEEEHVDGSLSGEDIDDESDIDLESDEESEINFELSLDETKPSGKKFVGGAGDADDFDDSQEFGLDEPYKTESKQPQQLKKSESESEEDEDEDEEEDEDEHYLKKFDKDVRSNYIVDFHPESVIVNFQEVQQLAKIIRNEKGIICDEFHKTIPVLTKYEKTRVLGQRARQINDGAKPYVKVTEYDIDGYNIAQMELGQKRLPFIIKRPLPNGGSEYWKLADLQLI